MKEPVVRGTIPSLAARLAALACLVLWTAAAPTEANAAPGCRKPAMSGANKPIDPSRIDQRLFNAALTAEINYLRCRKNLSKLSSAGGLQRVAIGHASWMAKSRRLTHVSSVRGKRTPSERILGTGIKARMGSENIAKVSLYRLDEVGRFRIADASSCQFATTNGTRIGRHTYASLAGYVANLWYRSAGHRKNMMDGRVRLMGTGAGFDARGGNCGQIYVTQAFAG